MTSPTRTWASSAGWRNRCKTCLKMFMEPWLAQAERRGHPTGLETRSSRPHAHRPPVHANRNQLNMSKDDFEDKW